MSEPVAPMPETVVITRGELVLLSVGMWLSGVCLLALLPVVLTPRLGPALGLAATYLLFFVAWQPLQRVTQRAFGPRAAFIRTMALVATAAVAAYYLREALLGLIRRAA
jgi:uncharacterized membrane protein YGL010W